MSESKAVRYFEVPANIDLTGQGLVTALPLKDDDGKPKQKRDENGDPVVDEHGHPVYELGKEEFTFSLFFQAFLLPRIPNKTGDQCDIVIFLVEKFRECKPGERAELHASAWEALSSALPGTQGEGSISSPWYMAMLPFYAAVRKAPPTKPPHWKDEPQAAEPAEKAEVAE